MENEQGIELLESETDNSEKESESENQEKKLDDRLISNLIHGFDHAIHTQKIELDKILLQTEIYREIISPPPELS